MIEPILRFKGVTRTFMQGGAVLEVLKGVDLSIEPGEIVALLGASGAGKSTLLQAAGLLESGFGGRIEIAGTRVESLSADARTTMRRTRLGFVYQFHHLLPDFSAEENVMLPQLIAGVAQAQASARARTVLGDLGLSERLSHKPAQLSGGEQQRVAVARALANEPLLILADEPTGNLDETTGRRVLAEFIRLARARGSAALIATHNQELARSMDRVVVLKEGAIVVDTQQKKGRLD
jgi:lipoprotein-releasing system ATP-binding protein